MKVSALIFSCLFLISCFGEKEKKPNSLTIEVQASQRKPINQKDLGLGALDYSKLSGILVELIPKGFELNPAKVKQHRVIFKSSGNEPQYLCIRPQDQVFLDNRSHRPIILDSYDNLPGFPVKIECPAPGEKMIVKLPLTKLCRNAVIFDRSGNYKIILTCNPHHKAYVSSHQKKSFGQNPDDVLAAGEWTLRLSHPRLLDHEETVLIKKNEALTHPVIHYSLPALNSKDARLPKVP
jgi:hypothetical protein